MGPPPQSPLGLRPCEQEALQWERFNELATSKATREHISYSRVAYVADCGSRGFCMIIFGQYTKIIGKSIRKQKNHVAYFYDGFPVFRAIFSKWPL